MASRALKRITRRTEDGREVFRWGDRWFYTEAGMPPEPEPTAEEIIAKPTERHPRFRLRVFDLCWPWRASYGEAARDALLSRNMGPDGYLDAAANVERDPPLRGGIRIVGVLS